jgi:hypothetical protein
MLRRFLSDPDKFKSLLTHRVKIIHLENGGLRFEYGNEASPEIISKGLKLLAGTVCSPNRAVGIWPQTSKVRLAGMLPDSIEFPDAKEPAEDQKLHVAIVRNGGVVGVIDPSA